MNKYLLVLIALLFGLFFLAYVLRRWKWVSNLALAGAAVLFIVLVSEFTYRWFFRRGDIIKQQECMQRCFLPDSLLGFKPGLPGSWRITTLTPGGDTVVDTRYTILSDSIYNHRVSYSNVASRNDVIFLGCSFTFGESIADTATLPYLFGRSNNITTVNLGCPAYGLHQVYQLWKTKYGNISNEGRVFVYSLLSDHFYRAAGVYDWNLDGPYFRQVADSVVFAGRVDRNINMRYRRAPYYLSFFGSLRLVEDKLSDYALRKRMKSFDQQEYDRIFSLLKNMSAAITKSGGKLIILNWDRNNWGYQGYDFPFQEQLDKDVQSLQQAGVSVIPVSSFLNYNDPANFIPNDGHPTLLANQRISARLADIAN